MQWQSNNEDREKQMRNMIQRLEKTGEKAIANATQKGKIWNPLFTRKATQAQIRVRELHLIPYLMTKCQVIWQLSIYLKRILSCLISAYE